MNIYIYIYSYAECDGVFEDVYNNRVTYHNGYWGTMWWNSKSSPVHPEKYNTA